MANRKPENMTRREVINGIRVKLNSQHLPAASVDAITVHAQNARLYRIAARMLRTKAQNETQTPAAAFLALPMARKAELIGKACKMEKNARVHERAIVAVACAIENGAYINFFQS